MSNTGVLNIYKIGNRYKIIKRINKKNHFFGSYASLEEAQEVKKELEKSNWNGLMNKE